MSKKRDLVAEYEELTKNALRNDFPEGDTSPDENPEVTDFLARVLGPDRQRWSNRVERCGYGCEDECSEESD